ncbi:MAG: ABC transporter permease subunit [Thaumarchaeota archaeon]|nr:ABC transporter permease subunit [Nitrososphaerota archaeon]
MRFDKALLIFRKDWREIRRNWQVIGPMIVVPLLLSVMLPVLIGLVPSFTSTQNSSTRDLESVLRGLPNNIREEVSGLSGQEIVFYIMISYFFAPFFLIIPVMASTVIASDSFAGEKERRTIEALLASPISDGELLLGKILVSFIPSMFVTFGSFIVYSTVVISTSAYVFGALVMPPLAVWIPMIFGLTPVLSLTAIGLTVIISSRVKGFREAQQISGLLLIPIIILVLGQVSGALILGPLIVGLLILVFAAIDLAVFVIGVRLFRREEILSKLA